MVYYTGKACSLPRKGVCRNGSVAVHFSLFLYWLEQVFDETLLIQLLACLYAILSSQLAAVLRTHRVQELKNLKLSDRQKLSMRSWRELVNVALPRQLSHDLHFEVGGHWALGCC